MEGFKDYDKDEQPRKLNLPLREAILAAGVLLGATEAGAADARKIAQPKRIEHVVKEKKQAISIEKWFKQKQSPENLKKIENLVLENKMPLKDQLKYFEHALKQDGYLHTELYNEKLTPKRLSTILEMNSKTSVRLKERFLQNPNDPALKVYFNLDKERNASTFSQLELKPDKKTAEKWGKNCNGYYTFTRGDVYFVTADHCIADTIYEADYVRSQRSDLAVRYVPPSEYGRNKITDTKKLPSLTEEMSPDALSGQVTVTFSYRMNEKKEYTEQIEFSIAMPMTRPALNMLHGRNVESLAPAVRNSLYVIRPPEDGKVVKRVPNPEKGKPDIVTVRAGGTSGSIVTIPRVGQVAGTLTAVRILQDDCNKLCHTTGVVSNPARLRSLITRDQEDRALKGLGEGPLRVSTAGSK